MDVKYKSAKEIAQEWGLTVRRVQMLCTAGKLEGAKKIGNIWVVPANVERPADNRMTSGEFRKSTSTRASNANVLAYNRSMKINTVVSHEVRTNLNTIMMYSDMIATHIDDSEKVLEYSQLIKNSGRSILNLVNNAMELSRLSAGAVEIREEVVNVESLIGEVLETHKVDTKRKNITVNVKYDVNHEYIYTDTDKMIRILDNILDNAIKYSRHDSQISINVKETSAAGGKSTLSYVIEDEGIGMSQDFISRIFEYFTVESNNLKNSEGGGLGMTIVKKLTELLNGSIRVDSKLDEGTRVEMSFSYRIADLSTGQHMTDDGDVDRTIFEGKRILLAEDNELNRTLLAELLGEYGMAVDTAEDGILCVATLEKADGDGYDMIIMDLQMPNMDGIAATKIIRGLADTKKAQIPIVALTASVTTQDREDALKSGMNGFVEKPLDIKKLGIIMQQISERGV